MKDQLFLALAAYKAALARIDKRYTCSALDDVRRAVALRSLLTKIEVSSFVACLSHIGSLENIDLSVEIRALEATLELPYYTGYPGYNDLVENVAQSMWYPKPVPSLTALEERIARIEKRENALAEIYRQMAVLEVQMRHRSEAVRTEQLEYRVRLRTGVRRAGEEMPSALRDPQIVKLRSQLRALSRSACQIREVSLPTA